MQQSFDLFFVSSNNHKYQEAEKILNDFWNTSWFFLNTILEEIQSNSLKDIALKKARDAFSKYKKPVMIEDDWFVY